MTLRTLQCQAPQAKTIVFMHPREAPHIGKLLDLFTIHAVLSYPVDEQALAAWLAPGDLVELREGCDRRFSTCRDRFRNKDNFRGEPQVPGPDSVIRYPSL